MIDRLDKELALLKTVFPDVEFREADSGWFRIPRYTVQFGGWKQTEVAVCFQAVEDQADTTGSTAKQMYPATGDDFEIQSGLHVELTDAARSRIITNAWDTGTSPVEFHSHPGDPWQAMFSPSDLYGFSE